MTDVLSEQQLRLIDAYWRAANYLSVGQIYLLENPLLREPLKVEHVKPRLLGHWGTTPGLNFIYVHLNRVIKERDLDVIYVAGPGHGGPGMVANTYLEGTYSEVYPNISQDAEGACGACSGSSRSRAASPATPPRKPRVDPRGRRAGLLPGPRVRRRVRQPGPDRGLRGRRRRGRDRPAGDRLALEQVPQSRHDGAVLPILHLNGYKIANPTVLARISRDELRASSPAMATSPTSSKGTTRRRCTS